MKKITISLGTAAIALMFWVGCAKSTLELNNPNQITSVTYWKTETDVQSALAATYGLLRDVNGGFWGVRGIELGNGRGDDFFIRHDVADLYQLTTYTNTPDNGVGSSLWNIAFRGIFRANQIMENIDRVTSLDEAAKAAYIAEAKFLRGLNYFILAINFGDVPLILQTAQSQDDYFNPKTPQAEVWKQVEADFKAAADGLPVEYPASMVGRATKGAALAYLGKSYLYTADWANTVSTLMQLTKSPFSYALMANYGDNFIDTKENNLESIFEIQLGDVGGTNAWGGENSTQALGVTTAQEFAPAEVSGWFEISPTDVLFKEFQKEKTVSGDFDPRMYATLVWDYPGAKFYNKPFSSFSVLFGYHSMIKKYQNYNQVNELSGASGASNYTSSNNERALRYDDVLLMIAEALTMQNKQAEAYPYITQIRSRAKLKALATGFTKDQMLAEIRHQRMIEFARENQRFYDLRRWGLLDSAIAACDKEGKQFFVEKKHDYLPIPQSEINSNPQMVQNPNWE
ncbi:MAG TPA: RagB/SusD family nutrient uptake outer membrane protein [Arachidicoccus sp.]|nr:RagB/SusD family nutrient uptake outer membrane protein [Arachidicoccus sp.]